MTRRATMRASDADREHIADRLRQATAEGRLLAHELDERLGTALTARTYGELDAIVADLPAASTVEAPARRSMPRWPLALVAGAIALALVVIAAIGSALGEHEHAGHHLAGMHDGAWVIWLIWLAIGWRLLLRRRRAR